MIKDNIKNIVQRYFPFSIEYIIMLRAFKRRFPSELRKLFNRRKYASILKNSNFTTSKDITYGDVISSTFTECYNIFKQSDIIYFGEINKGCHRFIIVNEDLENLEDLENQLLNILKNGFIIEIEKYKSSTEVISDKEISLYKLRKSLKSYKLLRIYKIYKNSSGLIEFAGKIAFEIERWYQLNGILITRSRNNIQNKLTREALLSTENIKLFGYQIKQLKDTFLYFKHLDKISVKEFDLVYTWVNGNEDEWIIKKSKYLNSILKEKSHNSATSNNRFDSRDELKYSLRSVEKYLLGYRKIFIVTDGQKPDWLLESDNIVIVDHKDIFPNKEVLPVFNSHAIESCLHKIKGLSEHYLYLNDDIIFGRSVNISLFFPQQHEISIFPSSQTFIPFGNNSKELLPVDSAAINTRTLLERESIGYAVNKFKHTPLPQIKSIMKELEDLFYAEFETTRNSRFRQPSDLSVTSSLLFNYAYLKGNAKKNQIKYAYINLSSDTYKFDLTKTVLRSENKRPDVFCVNDVEGDLDSKEVKINFVKIMDKFLPDKSVFEI